MFYLLYKCQIPNIHINGFPYRAFVLPICFQYYIDILINIFIHILKMKNNSPVISYSTILILIHKLNRFYRNKSIKIKITILIVTTVEIFINILTLPLFIYDIIYHLTI